MPFKQVKLHIPAHHNIQKTLKPNICYQPFLQNGMVPLRALYKSYESKYWVFSSILKV